LYPRTGGKGLLQVRSRENMDFVPVQRFALGLRPIPTDQGFFFVLLYKASEFCPAYKYVKAMLVSPKIFFRHCYGKYAIAAVNIFTMEQVHGLFSAAVRA